MSSSGRFLVKENGQTFFYLADTAWELFHRLNREQAVEYLNVRAQQGFTAIQAVALAELDGITEPNAYGALPLVDRNPAQPAITPGSDPSKPAQYDYWDHVDYIVDEANRRGLYVAMLPTWGRWIVRDKRKDESIFTRESAESYGKFLGARFGRKSIIWILGGDRDPTGVEELWRALAKGIAVGVSGREDYSAVLMSFHPRGGQTSATSFHTDPWLDFNMQQNGHNFPAQRQPWKAIARDYALMPSKPVVDGEPLYEDHPLGFNSKVNGYSFDAHVRQYLYWDLFSGACGFTYGNHAVWQMFAPGRTPVNGPLMYWYRAIHRPGAGQMRYARELMEARPASSRVPDQSLIADELDGADHIAATRGDGYAFVYSAQGRPFTVNTGKISGKRLKCWWFNPRSGDAISAGAFDNTDSHTFTPPSQGFGSDWVLILDDDSRGFAELNRR